MSIFSTRNSDGSSGLAEPTSTISRKEYAKLKREADRHSCGTVAEFVAAPASHPGGRNGFDPKRAGEN